MKPDLPAVLRDFGNRTQGEDPVIHFYEHFPERLQQEAESAARGILYAATGGVVHCP